MMPSPTLREARQIGMSIYSLTSRSESSTTTLSSGALASIVIVGSVFFFLIIVGPLLIKLAKRRSRRHVSEGSITTLSSVEHGQLSHDENFNGPRRLRKRSVVSDGVMYFGMKDVGSEEGSRDGGGRVGRHLSLPTLPPAISRPESFGNERVGRDGNGDRYKNRTRPGVDSCASGEQMYGSPEKRRGHAIYQNRRKTSWIDEDALHGPRVSPKRDTKRKSNWLPGRGLTRTLSRHLSIRRFHLPELNRSPTLPYIETGPGRDIVVVEGTPRKSPESRKTGCANDPPRARELKTEAEPRFPIRQPLREGGSLNNSKLSHVHIGGSSPQRASVPSATPSYPRSYNNTASGAAQQLVGRAPVPSFDIGVGEQRYSRLQQRNTDRELQAILRRTAERLQDGNRSTRRQTLMLPSPSSSPARVPGQTTRGGPDQDYWCGKDHTYLPGSAAPSPTRSQKSAPAVMLQSELEGCSSRIQQGPSQGGAPWQTHRRTYTREISHVSQQMAQIPMLPKPDNLVATPTRRRSQADILHTAFPSPSRSMQTPPSHPQQELSPRSYSPASEKSSALSTVYSEEEDGLPTSAPQLEDIPGGGSEMERQAMAQALRASDAFCGEQTQRDGDAETGEGRREIQDILQTSYGPQPFHKRNGTLERIFPNSVQTTASSPSERQVGTEQPAARFSPHTMPTIQTLQTKIQDPFTTCTTPNRLTPQRLSQFFSPLPAKPPSHTMNSSVDITEPNSGTPTPSPSHRRVVPPPHRLRPGANALTPGHYHDPQFQIQLPSRVPSPVESESGLSSVYDSYRYSRCSSVEGSQTLARLSATTMLTVPPAEASPTQSRWDQTPLPTTSTESQTSDREMESGGAAPRSAHLRLHNALSGAGAYTHFVGSSGFSTMENGPIGMGYTAEDALPRSQPHRDITGSTVSCLSGESTYSQDEDGGDKLAPLMPIYSTTAAPGKHTSRVMNAVAELRRMNSQVSCVSAHSTATTNITSPTLPALRGGGCSPGKRGTVGAAKNYFSLGNSPSSGNREGEYGYEERRRLDAGDGRDDEAQNEKTTASVEISRDSRDEYTPHKGGKRRSRRNTVVESYEQDLDRARQVFRQSRGYNLQSIREVSNAVGSGGLMIQVTK
ncbi:hypothetical protein F4782DRAFT_81310 [Xylaria castorea]|nr:hypothetical protein F4782DRAFT_81310 [Xylaria castorea]